MTRLAAVLRGMRQRGGTTVMILAVALVATAAAAAGPIYYQAARTSILRDTVAGAALVRGLTAAPDLDGWTVVERLLEDLASLQDRIWLVLDDVHELGSAEALRQLELLLASSPRKS